MAWNGKYKVKNPDKYVGDPTNVFYRSRIELRYFQYFDEHPDIIAWNSEETVVSYFDPVKNKNRRYYPDVMIKKSDGTTMMIEFKHSSDLKEPKKPQRMSKRYITEAQDWITNNAKWVAAKAYCAERGWQFTVLSEKELGKRY